MPVSAPRVVPRQEGERRTRAMSGQEVRTEQRRLVCRSEHLRGGRVHVRARGWAEGDDRCMDGFRRPAAQAGCGRRVSSCRACVCGPDAPAACGGPCWARHGGGRCCRRHGDRLADALVGADLPAHLAGPDSRSVHEPGDQREGTRHLQVAHLEECRAWSPDRVSDQPDGGGRRVDLRSRLRSVGDRPAKG